MNEQSILEGLSSNDNNLIISALFQLGSEKSSKPSSLILARVVELISHPDPDVRHRAIFTVGIHWASRAALPSILKTLHDAQEAPLVITCAASAIGTIAHEDRTVRKLVVSELAKVVTNTSVSHEVRDVTYISALWASHQITPDEYAQQSVLAGQNDMDRNRLAAELVNRRPAL